VVVTTPERQLSTDGLIRLHGLVPLVYLVAGFTADPAAPEVGSVVTGHTGGVYAAAFTPVGHTLATAGLLDGTVFLWAIDDPASPQRVGSPLHPAGGADRLDFDPDGHILAAGGTEGALLWDIIDPTAPQQLAPPLTGHTGGV
jgi:WD40 repeat protein